MNVSSRTMSRTGTWPRRSVEGDDCTSTVISYWSIAFLFAAAKVFQKVNFNITGIAKIGLALDCHGDENFIQAILAENFSAVTTCWAMSRWVEVEMNLNIQSSRVHRKDLISGTHRRVPVAIIGFTAQNKPVRGLASSDFASVARKNSVILLGSTGSVTLE